MDIQEVGSEGGHGLDWFGAGYGQAAGACECGNELS